MTTDDGRPEIGGLVRAELPAAVALHRRLLPHGFFVELGEPVLSRYYQQFLDGPHAYARAAHVDGRLVGAIVGTLDHQRHLTWAAGEVAPMTVAILRGLVRQPRLIRPFVRTRLARYTRSAAALVVRRAGRSPTPCGEHVVAVLAHVFVAEDARGWGLGGRLVDGFLSAARNAGAARGELLTLAGDAGAGGFYARRGWRRTGTAHEVDGRRFEEWALDLHGPQLRPAVPHASEPGA